MRESDYKRHTYFSFIILFTRIRTHTHRNFELFVDFIFQGSRQDEHKRKDI